MKTFLPEYLSRKLVVVPPYLQRTVGQIREYKGKQEMYAERKPEVLESLRQVAFIESVESSNRLERIQTDRKSLAAIIERRADVTTRPQAELAGYRDVLENVHQHAEGMVLTPSLVLQLHRDLMSYTATPGGSYKKSPNDIVEKNEKGAVIRVRFQTIQPFLVTDAMTQLHTGYEAALQEYEPLLLIPNYVHDFLCVHPFSDGNGRMARILSVLLLYKQGFNVCRYISLERLIEDTKETYYESLMKSDIGWNQGEHNHLPFTEYLLGVVLAAYRKLESNIGEIETGRGYKTALVRQAVQRLPTQFGIGDVEAHCPSVGRDTIRNVLQKMAAEGLIHNATKGRAAKWRKKG